MQREPQLALTGPPTSLRVHVYLSWNGAALRHSKLVDDRLVHAMEAGPLPSQAFKL